MMHQASNRLLKKSDALIVFNLFDQLDAFAGKVSGIFDEVKMKNEPVEANVLRRQCKDYWYRHDEVIDQFLQTEGKHLSAEEKQIAFAWKGKVMRGRFLCIKSYDEYTAFLPMNTKDKEYFGVIGLSVEIENVIHGSLPTLVDTALLPFKDKIIWDGLAGSYGLSIGPKMKKVFWDECTKAHKEGKIKTSL